MAVFLGLLLTSLWMMPLGLAAARVAGSQDPGAMMHAIGLGWAGAVLMVLATVTTNFVNIYMSGLAWKSLFPRTGDQWSRLVDRHHRHGARPGLRVVARSLRGLHGGARRRAGAGRRRAARPLPACARPRPRRADLYATDGPYRGVIARRRRRLGRRRGRLLPRPALGRHAAGLVTAVVVYLARGPPPADLRRLGSCTPGFRSATAGLQDLPYLRRDDETRMRCRCSTDSGNFWG